MPKNPCKSTLPLSIGRKFCNLWVYIREGLTFTLKGLAGYKYKYY